MPGMFPTITHLNDLLPHVSGNAQIRVKPDELSKCTVVCYMVQDEDTFAGEGPAAAFERECRGVTFNPDGTIAARTLHKFFNVGEREDTQPQNLQWASVRRIMDKRDGSMITPVLVDGVVVCKTKKTFTSDEATAATEFLYKDPARAEWVAAMLRHGMTPTFEWTSPRFPIVLKYDRDELTLLHVRENVSGRYLSESELRYYLPTFNQHLFPIVENVIDQFYGEGVPAKLVSWDKLRDAAATRTGIEGWIIQFDTGEMVKLKTAWYNELHHAVTFTRWRDIARTVVLDQADDLKGAFAMTGRDTAPIARVERAIRERIAATSAAVEAVVARAKADGLTAKDLALSMREDQYFGLIMRRFRDQEVDYLEHYAKHHLEQDWGLEVVA